MTVSTVAALVMPNGLVTPPKPSMGPGVTAVPTVRRVAPTTQARAVQVRTPRTRPSGKIRTISTIPDSTGQ